MKSRRAIDCGVAASATRARLLQAAETIVREAGVVRLSLDLVAHRAGVSKGGLLYHFASKESLLTALLADYVQCMEQRTAEASKALVDNSEGGGLKARIVGSLGDNGLPRWSGAALLVALAYPALLTPVRERIVCDTRQLVTSSPHWAGATVVALAIDGLILHEALNVSSFNREQRRALVDRLTKLADEAFPTRPE